MSLVDLPAELVAQVARYLPRADQARLSLISRLVRPSVQHELYRDVELDLDTLYDADLDEFLAGKCRPRAAVASLADDPVRCALLRRFAIKDHDSWLDPDAVTNIGKVLRQATLLDEVGILHTDTSNGEHEDPSTASNIQRVWDVLPVLPALRRLTIHVGPVAALNLDKLVHLRQLEVEITNLDSTRVGALPSSLEVLSLAQVAGLTTTWFSPSLFSHLRSLTLYHLEAPEIRIVEHALEEYARSARPSTLTHLHLDLHPYEMAPHDPAEDPANTALVIRVLRAFKPLADSVEKLEVMTSPQYPYHDDSSPIIAASVISALTSSFTRVKHLQLFMGDETHGFFPYKTHDLMQDLVLGLARCTLLRRLDTNVFRPTRATRRLDWDTGDDVWQSAFEEAVWLSASHYFDRLPTLDAAIVSPDECYLSRKAFVRPADGVGAPRLVDEMDLPRVVA
ncbi:hypothetical protein JCM3775_007303 [Rhodotorula graminis]